MERNVTRDEFNRYIVDIQERWPLPFWIARSFRTAEEWDRWSSLEFRARASNHREVQLNNVLYHRHTVVLGEAGSGKSVVARKAIELAACRSRIRHQAAAGSWTMPRQWEIQRTWLNSARAAVRSPAKPNGV